MALTFVTAFLDLAEDRSKDKSVERCFILFQTLLTSGIKIHLFLSESFRGLYETHLQAPNLTVEFIELTDLDTYKELEGIEFSLPENRTDYHDTKNFMILMNSKVEFIRRASEKYDSTHFAWIDFSICHVFKDVPATLLYLKMLGSTDLKDSMLVFPGCWQKGEYIENAFACVVWRFCGGFFIGDRASLLDMNRVYRQHFAETVRLQQKLSWEVNIWAYMEMSCGWSPSWYFAGHDDTIVKVPGEYLKVVASLTTIPSRIDTTCRLAIDSLLPQVDRIYLSVAREYKRFPGEWSLPAYLSEEAYAKVEVVWGEDLGPASKYLGAIDRISPSTWIFFCDDDQEYSSLIIRDLSREARQIAVYQNHYAFIRELTSGGLIHGYVGNFMHSSFLQNLRTFPLPEAARFVDDQWMSIYLFKQGIPVLPSGLDWYQHIFSVLQDNHEKWSVDSLAELGNRADKVAELARMFDVIFLSNGDIISCSHLEAVQRQWQVEQGQEKEQVQEEGVHTHLLPEQQTQ